MVEWLAGNRIRGTSTERTSTTGFNPVSGGWVELGRTTLGSANADITVTGLADKRYYKVLTDINGKSANFDVGVRFNDIETSTYARRFSTNGGTDITTGSLSAAMWVSTGASLTLPEFGVHYIANKDTKEKLFLGHAVRQNTAGAGTAPERCELTGKHAQTTDPISSITVTSAGASTFNTGSEVVVLGWDPADTHTTNFWEELASVELGSAADDLSSGIFTAKKYLWVQAYSSGDGGSAGGGAHAMGGNSNSLNGAVGGDGKGGTNFSAINSLLIDTSAGYQDGSTGNYYVAGGGAGSKDHSQGRSKGGGGESGNGAGAIAIPSTGSGGGGGSGAGATGGTGANGILILSYQFQ